jgi:hypothetical protein
MIAIRVWQNGTLGEIRARSADDARQCAARVRLIVWCKHCQRQVEPDPAEMAARRGAGRPVLDWCERLGSQHVGMVVTGTRR